MMMKWRRAQQKAQPSGRLGRTGIGRLGGRSGLLLLLGLACLLSGCQASGPSGSTSQSVAPVEKPLPQGQSLFLAHCVSCHTGAGDPPGPNAAILDSSRLQTEASLRELLRHPTSPMMRPFSPEELSDADVHTLYEYLKTAKSHKQAQ